jgi:hypothetical protein
VFGRYCSQVVPKISRRGRERAHGEDFVCAQRLDGVFRDRDDTDRFTQRIEEFQHTSSRTGGGMFDEIDHRRDVAGAKPMLRE